jgi:hypothetical protein
MRLVTFITKNGERRSGALIDGGRTIADLHALYLARFGLQNATFSSVLSIAEGGANALDLAADLLKQVGAAGSGSVIARDSVKLDAPIPRPPQMRDFLCKLLHQRNISHLQQCVLRW